ncbi:MAG: nuclear transport factor 2 family protein [Candidatus Aminicenantes bacterium]|jgi:hypothetical protein
MKKASLMTFGLLFIGMITTGILNADSKAEVEKVIKASYFNGAFNDLDTVSMRKGFHPDFAIFSAKGNAINRYPIDTWIKGIEKRKQDPNFDPSQAKMDCTIASLDITEGCAAAKIEISKNGKMIFTDYLSLLKFEDGWKIVAKVYHAHPK